MAPRNASEVPRLRSSPSGTASTNATKASVMASTSTICRIWLRSVPTDRSTPISWVRASTDTASVLASPSSPATAAAMRIT